MHHILRVFDRYFGLRFITQHHGIKSVNGRPPSYNNSHSLSALSWCYPTTTCYTKTPFILISLTSSAPACESRMGTSDGALVVCDSHIRLVAGCNELIWWFLTHRFDQTVHRVWAASTVKSTASRCVCVSCCFHTTQSISQKPLQNSSEYRLNATGNQHLSPLTSCFVLGGFFPHQETINPIFYI